MMVGRSGCGSPWCKPANPRIRLPVDAQPKGLGYKRLAKMAMFVGSLTALETHASPIGAMQTPFDEG
jgi:hypothetical protein